VHVFLGVTGASGAPYAARLLEAFAESGCEVGLCASRAGVEVLYDERDWHAPDASGSARVDAYVICPCSMGTLGTIASGAMSNLIQRAASVALKEGRKLVLCPRETPLSLIHLENMLRVRQAGAVVLFLAPGFYAGAASVDDLVDFVVGRCLDQLGLEHELVRRWGQA
jgi:4-hydroxy-3-polyprenylbenzoate decarboxylase